jgi:hypothetical protein
MARPECPYSPRAYYIPVPFARLDHTLDVRLQVARDRIGAGDCCDLVIGYDKAQALVIYRASAFGHNRA